MAENAVVKESLTSDMIDKGAALVEALDDRGGGPTAALWYYTPDWGWRLIVAFDNLSQTGPMLGYKVIADALATRQTSLHEPPFQSVRITDSRDPLIQLLHRAITTGRADIGGIRLAGNAIDGTVIEDAYIYRLALGR